MRVHGARDRVVAAHHRQRLMHALLVEAAGLLQAAPQPQDGLLIEDGDRVPGLAFEDDEPDGVGAEVDHGAAG
jgi:hypothetical protein